MKHSLVSKFLPALACVQAIIATPLLAAPEVHLETRHIDLGTVQQGEAVTTELAIGNNGDETLVIERMEFSVPGLTARLKQRISPGEAATIRLRWDTGRLRNAIQGRMTLFLNDPATPRVEIDLQGAVIPAIEFQPRPALYLSQFAGEQTTGSVTLQWNRESPLEIERITASSDRFVHSLGAVTPGHTFEVTVSTRANVAPGRYPDHLLIETGDPDYPQLRVEVNILVKPDLFLSPEVVDFGRLSRSTLVAGSGAAEFVRQSAVISRRTGTMSITSLSSDLSELELSLTPKGRADGFLLELGLDPEQLVPGPLEGAVIIETDDPAFPRLTLPVRGVISE